MDQIQLRAEEPVRLDVVDGVARLVLQRPAVLNAVSEELLDGLLAALDSPVLDRAGAPSALLLSEALDAPTLLGHGRVSAVVDDGDALAGAIALARRVAGVSPGSLLATRRLVDLAPTQDLVRHLAAEEREF